MNKYSLEEFVALCNDCSYQITEISEDDALKLARDFQKLYDSYKHNKNIEEVEVYEEENREFFKCLLARKDAKGRIIIDEYTFMQDKNIIAKVNVFEAFTEENILSQKWHVLISLLALIDTANYDDRSTLLSKWAKGKIDSININKEKEIITIKAVKVKTTTYNSKSMNEWILEATKGNISRIE